MPGLLNRTPHRGFPMIPLWGGSQNKVPIKGLQRLYRAYIVLYRDRYGLGLPKMRDAPLGVPGLRIRVFWASILGSVCCGNYHIGLS